ncbi:MAG TPA: FAD-dependent oxidoreductase [bacterium]|nr:FAD-dependent oxidoreductase [bacterium]
MKKFDALIIGGGPGGYTAAELLGRQGKRVALFEKNKIGGSCLQVGCIPTKSLQAAAVRYFQLAKEGAAWGLEADHVRLNFKTLIDRTQKTLSILERGILSLLSAAKVEVVQGEAQVQGPYQVTCNGEEYAGDVLFLALGSRPRTLPAFPLGEDVVTSDGLLSRPRLPKSLLIVGAGVIGLEFACLYAQLGVKVRVGDVMPSLLPNMEEELAQLLLNSLRKLGVEVQLGLPAVERGSEEMVLVAVGRQPNVDLAGIPSLGLKIQNGKIETNGFLETSVPRVYALGDLTSRFPYAHTAYEQARVAVGHLAGSTETMDESKIPHVVFTSPEIAAVGLTEKEAALKFKNVKTRKANFAANSKARILGEIQGFQKTVYDGDSGRILGVHLAGPEATDLIGEACVLVARGVTMEELSRVVHPHPTLNEIFGSH